MGHPDIREAAVIGVPDDRWDERSPTCVFLLAGTETDLDELPSFLDDKVARWWVPEGWATIAEVRKTSVGKFDTDLAKGPVVSDDLDDVGRGTAGSATMRRW